MKRNITLLFLMLAALFALIACSGGGSDDTANDDATSSDNGEATEELADELYVFNWADYIPQEVLDKFTEETGVKIIYDTFSSNQEMLTKLKSGTVKYDVIFPTDYFLELLAEEELLLELDLDNIPNFANIDDDLKDQSFDPGNKYSIPFMYGSIGIAYNTKYVEKPTSWKDFWNPEYSGKVSMQETPLEVVSMALQMLGHDIHEPSDEQLAEAKEKLLELNEHVLTYSATPNNLFVSEQAWIGYTYGDAAGKAHLENPDVSYVLPEEGGILWMDTMAIPTTSQNKYTAEVFINFILDPEISKMITDYNPGSNPNAAARELMTEEELNNPASYPEIPENAEYFKVQTPETVNKFNEIFREIKVD